MRALLLTALVAVAASSSVDGSCAAQSQSGRVDCHPEPFATPSNCAARGCCWAASSYATGPYCFFPVGVHDYDVAWTRQGQGGTSFSAGLKLARNTTLFGGDAPTLQVDVWFEAAARLRFTVSNPAQPDRFVPPIPVPAPVAAAGPFLFDFRFVASPFSIAVVRRTSGVAVFNTSGFPLIFSDQYLQLTTAVPTATVYGMGEHAAPLLLPFSNFTTLSEFPADHGAPVYDYSNL